MRYLSVVVLILCAAVFLGVTAYDYERLPEKMVSQFDANGAPSAWMTKGAFFRLMLAVGLGLPLLPVAAFYSLRFLPANCVNLPEYWKQPENYTRLCRFLFASSLWYSAGFLLWQTALGHLVADANMTSPPQLSSALMLALCLALVVLTLVWILVLLFTVGRFGKASSEAA